MTKCTSHPFASPERGTTNEEPSSVTFRVTVLDCTEARHGLVSAGQLDAVRRLLTLAGADVAR